MLDGDCGLLRQRLLLLLPSFEGFSPHGVVLVEHDSHIHV
jgi:hypothetical protein